MTILFIKHAIFNSYNRVSIYQASRNLYSSSGSLKAHRGRFGMPNVTELPSVGVVGLMSKHWGLHLLIRNINCSHIHVLMMQHQEQFRVQLLAQGHFNILTAGSGVEPGTF